MAGHPPGPGLQALVGERLEPELDAIEGGGLAGVADPPLDVVELQELAFLRFGSLSQSKGELIISASFEMSEYLNCCILL